MKTLTKLARALFTAIFVVTMSATFVPITTIPAQAKSCGGLNQKACPWYKKGPECNAWLYKTKGVCRPCGGNGQRYCPILKKGPSCKPGLGISKGKCVPKSQTLLGKIGNYLSSGDVAKARSESKRRAGSVKPLVDALVKAIPRGRDATALINAIKNNNAVSAQTILLAKPGMTDLFAQLRRAGFRTATVGIESSAAYGIGVGRETGISIDLDYTRKPRLYTVTSVAGGYYFGGGNDLVISALLPLNNKIGGNAIGTIAEFDVGSGAGVNMWFEPKPFGFLGFSVGVGIGSAGGGGAATYGYTKVY